MSRKLSISCSLTVLTIVGLVSFSQPVLADGAPGVQWMGTFGGLSWDHGKSVQQTLDGGYIIAGATDSYGVGKSDVWLIKTDSEGKRVWDKTFGGGDNDAGESVQQTSDGGYVIGGCTWSYGAGAADVWLIKTDANGTEEWNETFGNENNDYCYSVRQTADGGYIMTGGTTSSDSDGTDLWLVKTDSDGNKDWDKIFGGTAIQYGSSVRQSSDGCYVVLGCTGSQGAGNTDMWLIKTDSNGNRLWDKTYGGTGWDQGYSVWQTSDGGFIMTGEKDTSQGATYDLWLVKADTSGNEEWNKTFGGEERDHGSSVQQTSDGGYIIGGYTSSYGVAVNDVWVIKTDDNGMAEWDRTFGGAFHDYGYSVQQTADGGYVVAGHTQLSESGSPLNEVWLIKIGSDAPLVPPVPELPSFIYVGLGLLSIGAIFGFWKTSHHRVIMG